MSSAPPAGTAWIVNSSVTGSIYPNNLQYTPLRAGALDWIDFQFTSNSSSTFESQIMFAMSSASTGSVRLQFDTLTAGLGSSPTTNPTLGTPFNLTPGNSTLIASASSTDSSSLSITTNASDIVYCRLTRSGTADTHVGDMRIIELRIH